MAEWNPPKDILELTDRVRDLPEFSRAVYEAIFNIETADDDDNKTVTADEVFDFLAAHGINRTMQGIKAAIGHLQRKSLLLQWEVHAPHDGLYDTPQQQTVEHGCEIVRPPGTKFYLFGEDFAA